jgi:hypothetical protein
VDKDGGIEADVRSRRVDLPITSPATLSSFGRYATAQGDQLGRGPLPPSAGEETRYWVFWNISGVTNPLSDVTVEGALPPYARFTGKQTVSLGSIIKREDGYIVWDVGNMDPNFAPGSRRIGAAFEIGVTPNEAHVGRPLTILDDMAFTARDAITGEVVQAFGARVTTNLPEDVMASGLGNVSPAIETVP